MCLRTLISKMSHGITWQLRTMLSEILRCISMEKKRHRRGHGNWQMVPVYHYKSVVIHRLLIEDGMGILTMSQSGIAPSRQKRWL